MGVSSTLRDWLVACEVTLVGMESTGVYWRPVFYLLEEVTECWLLNAAHMANVPGRKTDVADAGWIAQLVEHGLVRPSFVPPPPIRELRELTRYRKTQIEERSRSAQRLDKTLQDAGVKLSSVATDILGKSGRDMLDALVAGTRDPDVLAELARGRLRVKIPALTKALEGKFAATHALIVGEILAHLDYLDEAISRVSDRIEELMRPFAAERDLLATIPGVDRRLAEALVAEFGVDMARFGTAERLASWAGMCLASTSRRPSHAPVGPDTATCTCKSTLPSLPWQRPGPMTPTSPRSTPGSSGGGGRHGRVRPSGIPSSSPRST